MGNYNLPTVPAQLIGLGTKMVEGMQALSTPLGLTLITTAQMQTNLTAFITQDGAFNVARSAKQTALNNWTAARGNVYNWLLNMRSMLVTHFGTRWNTQWAQAGFTGVSTGIPSKIEDQLGLVVSLVNLLTKTPSYEVPSLNLTAAKGTALRTAALAAQSAVTAATVTINNIGVLWQAAYDVLVKGMRALLDNLRNVLGPDDTRWLTFGLQMPSTVTTPGQPVNVTATLDDTGAIIVQCDPVPLTTRYRWRMLLVGLQPDYQLVASTPGPIASITGVPPGQTAQIIVQAANGPQQSVASDPILVPVPVGAEAAKPAIASAKPAAPVGNGNGNGNGAHNKAPVAAARV